MKIKHFEEQIRGWLPQQPSKSKINSSKPAVNTSNQPLLRIGGILLPIIGAALIALYSFTLFNYGFLHFDLNQRWLLYCAYFIGIATAVAGVRLRTRYSTANATLFNKKNLIIGLSLLTLATFGSLISLEALIRQAISLTSTQFARIPWWDNPVIATVSFWILAFAGLLTVLAGKDRQSKLPTLTKTAIAILIIGVSALFFSALINVLQLTHYGLSSPLLMYAILFKDNNLLGIPTGILCLTFGWLYLLSTNLRLTTKKMIDK